LSPPFLNGDLSDKNFTGDLYEKIRAKVIMSHGDSKENGEANNGDSPQFYDF
jgi:hypothetical protein